MDYTCCVGEEFGRQGIAEVVDLKGLECRAIVSERFLKAVYLGLSADGPDVIVIP